MFTIFKKKKKQSSQNYRFNGVEQQIVLKEPTSESESLKTSVKYHGVLRYLIINDELNGPMNQLLKHKLVALVRNSIRNCCSQDALSRFEPHADSQSVENRDFLLYDSIHGSAPYRK